MSNQQIPRSLPELQGVSSASILEFLEAIEKRKLELHSFMFLRHGYAIAEGAWYPYHLNQPHMVFSLGKSFTCTAYGLAIAEGLLTLNDPVISFFPEYLTRNITKNMRAMCIRDLLSMKTGHEENIMDRMMKQKDGNWVKGFFEIPVDYPPNTHFVYNSGASYMLSAIIQKVTGMTLLEYLYPRLLKPLGIKGATWDTCPRGINVGFSGFSIKTEDIARFGQLYLQKGLWNGKRILPKEWVEEAITCRNTNGIVGDNDWQQGYGYHFWGCRYGAYRADGAFGQFCIVIPNQDAVIAMTGGVQYVQAVLNLLWRYLIPGMLDDILSIDNLAKVTLQKKLNSLVLCPDHMTPYSASVSTISGKRYKMLKNKYGVKMVSFIFEKDVIYFSWWDSDGEHRITCGVAEWLEEKVIIFGKLRLVAASGTWSDEHTFIMTWRFIETPFCKKIVCHFEGDEIRLDFSYNVSFEAKERLPMNGILSVEMKP